MGYLASIYVIKKTRLKKTVIDFLNKFSPNRLESSDEYLIPQYSDHPIHEFDNVEKSITFLESNCEHAQSMYWKSIVEKNKNKHTMIFYTNDVSKIFRICSKI